MAVLMWRMVLFSNISKMLCFEQNVQDAGQSLAFSILIHTFLKKLERNY
jgi:hypothetical protein